MTKEPRSRAKIQRRIRVRLQDRSYDAIVGRQLLGSIHTLLPASLRPAAASSGGRGELHGRRHALILADQRLSVHSRRLQSTLEANHWRVTLISVRGGEAIKSIEHLYPIYGKMIKARADRRSVLFALGGGAIGDAGGFLASTWMRGIPWVGLPTTLLSQVDSSVGGKTAINHRLGKNLIGTFHQPSLTLCDTDLLSTLPKRDLISGLGEIVKIALSFDPTLFNLLEQGLGREILRQSAPALLLAISKAVGWKAKIVAQDEHELLGKRELLNLGHTLGHALETHTGYRTYRHGEAVFWGLRFAAHLSHCKGLLAKEENIRIQNFIAKIPLPPLPKDLNSKRLCNLMLRDKKATQGSLRFVLFENIGRLRSDSTLTLEQIDRAWRALRTY